MLFAKNPTSYKGKVVVRIEDHFGNEIEDIYADKGVVIVFADGEKVHLVAPPDYEKYERIA
jgi:hypothetical protein